MFEMENALGALLVQGSSERKKVDKRKKKEEDKAEVDPLKFLAEISQY